MTNTKTRTQLSIENGTKIVKRALKSKLSLSEAARQSNKGRNYVSDIKARLDENVKNKNITKKDAIEFKSLLKKYEAAA